MSETVSISVQGIKRIDLRRLEEMLRENMAGDYKTDSSENEELAEGKLGSPDLMNLAIQLAPTVVPAVVTVLTLWMTRIRQHTDVGQIIFEVDGDKIKYTKFNGTAIVEDPDQEAIKTALNARIQPRG